MVAKAELVKAADLDVMNTPMTFRTITAMCNTGMVPETYQNRPMEALTAMLMGKELGMNPLESLRRIHVIKGKPSPSAEWMIGRIFAAGHSLIAVEQTAQQCVVKGTRYKPNGDVFAESTVTYTIEMAHRAGLAGGGSWKKYPEIMLFWRASSQLARQMFSDLLGGVIHLAEELGVDDGNPAELPESVLPADIVDVEPLVEVDDEGEIVDAVIVPTLSADEELELVKAGVPVEEVLAADSATIPAAPVAKPTEEKETPRAAHGEEFCPGCYLTYSGVRIALRHSDDGSGPKWKCLAPADLCGGQQADTEDKMYAWSGWHNSWSMSVGAWADKAGVDEQQVAEVLTVWKQEQPQEKETNK